MSSAMTNLILFGLMLAVTGGAYAQEVVQKMRPTDEQPTQAPIDNTAFEKLLLTAGQLIKNGKSGDAYALLAPLEFDHAGEERFDYLIGIAALDSGKADKATFALERVLVVNPNSVAARLDMARAYYQLGDILRAKTEFMTVLQQNISIAARANVEKYLDEIAARESGKQTHITGYVEGSVGNDSNVNNSSSQSQVFVDLYAVNYSLDSANIKTSDNYYKVVAGGEIIHNLNTNWSWYAGVDVRQRSYYTQKSFDFLDTGGRAGVAFEAKSNHFRIGIMGDQYKLIGSYKSDTTGVNAEWRHVFSPGNQSKLFGQYTQYRFADVTMQPNDCDQQVASGSWLHFSADGKSTLSGGVHYGIEQDVSTIITPPATPSGGRADGSRRFGGLRIGSQTAVSEKTTLFANAGIQVSNYSRVNPLFLQQRKDRLYDLTLGASWHWNKLWTLRPQLDYSRNDSNIVIYGYNRTDVSLNIRRDFR